MRSQPPTRRAWMVWGFAAVVYLAAVFHRGSLGVAGPLAIERFGIGPAALSFFTVLQVSVYAAMQLPTGLLVDRVGPRWTLTLAVLLLGGGQLLFALAGTYTLGLLARVILGIGDAMTWVSVLRLAAAYFPARHYPLVVTLSSALGALGGVAATFPLAIMLHQLGWTATFVLVGAATASYASVTLVAVPDIRNSDSTEDKDSLSEVAGRVKSAWALPATRLAYWVHFSTMFVAGALALLWGYPYLVNGLALDPTTSGFVLSVLIIGQIIGGPIMGTIIGRYPTQRVPLVLVYLAVSSVCLAALIAWPSGQPPLALVIAAFAVFALGGPVSATAFAVVRDYNPLSSVGTATGLANSAGHTAIAVAVLTMGLVLQLAPTLEAATAYRLALVAPLAMLVFGAWRTFAWWRRSRCGVLAAQERGEDVPVPIRRRRWDLPSPVA